MQTKISFKHVHFSLFDKMNVDEFLMEDQFHDTLVYAGKLQVRITDWFFLKSKAEIKYLGLENAVIKLQKADTLWNYQFLVNYFTPTSKKSQKKSGIEFDLKKLSLKNVMVIQSDPYRGQDMVTSVGSLDMDANQVSIDKKNVDITSLNISKPLFSLYSYPGKPTSGVKKDTIVTHPKVLSDTMLLWNPAGWTMNIASLKIDNGVFKNIKNTGKESAAYFDPKDIQFTQINGQFTNVKLYKDTFFARVADMSTKERSGFLVRKLDADIRMNPKGMFFTNLDLHTNSSVVRNHFAMRYDDIQDMQNFIHEVNMDANFDDAQINTDDLVYFAPAMKTWKKNIRISGHARGTVDDIMGRDLVINIGGSTYINGDVTLTGLPDINRTFIDFKSNETRTNYRDIVRFVPAARKITQPDIAKLGNIHFTGSFTGFIRDFVTFGTIRTNLGTVKTDLNMKLPVGKEPIYSGNISTTGFRLGEFIHNSRFGLVSFSGAVRGHGSKLETLGADVKADIREFDYNGYRYRNIVANGKLKGKLFNGYASINDPNLQLTLNGLVNFNEDQSQFDLVADVGKANLRPLGFVKDSVFFSGKLNFNFTGNNIDNFLGTARITQANLIRNNQRLSFDSLVLNSAYTNGTRTLTVNSNQFDGSITGDFHITDLPNAIQLFLNKYYPSYIAPPTEVIAHQNFKFNLTTREIDPIVQLLDKNLSGFNDSKFEGLLDLPTNRLEIKADVPRFAYNQYIFTNTNIEGTGDLNQLSLKGNIVNVTVNDTINLPNTSFTILARHDSSAINLSAASNQAVSRANLNATVVTFTDGVKINFDTSNFVLNGKTWNIDRGGQLNFRKNERTAGEVVLHESNQVIKLKTVPSTAGSWNDLFVDLTNVNIGDITPYFIPKTRLEGLISGSAKVENPGSQMIATGDFSTQYFRFNGDSLGELKISKIVYDNQKDGNLKLFVTNPNPDHSITASVNVFLKGDHTDNLIAVDVKDYPVNILESFLGSIFSDINGYVTGKLNIQGALNSLNYVGKAHLRDAGLKVKFTQVYYKLRDADIDLREHEIDFGTLKLIDTLTGGTATFAGNIQHESWKNMFYDLDAKVDGTPMTLLNTTAADNSSFYGHAVGTGSMILVGPQNNMYLAVDGKASETDSSHITIPPAKSRSLGMADFLVERTHGYAVTDSILSAAVNKITYDIDLTADPHTTVEVILDEVTGDVIKGRGRGSLNIHAGTTEPLTLNGSYFLDEGSYRFTFQSFFKRPFVLRKEGNNYIKWNGDPTKATIHFDAQYTAEKVSFAPLAASWGLPSNVHSTRENVNVIVVMSGELFKPQFEFKLDFPSGSIAITDPTLAFNLTQIENNPNEINRQVTYLIVFNSFAPISNQGNATATTSTPISAAINELAYSTISSLLFNELNRQFSDILAKIFRDDKLKVNISGSVYNRNLVQQSSSNNFNINTGNVNITLSRGLFNDRLIITAGSTLDIPFETTLQQKFQFLPDVTAEWLINPPGTIRATFFYRQNLDFVNESSPSNPSAVTTGKNRRIGGGLAFRREFNRLGDVFRKRKKDGKNTIPSTLPDPLKTQQEEKKGSGNQ
jgi:hypothetical protein